MNTLAIIASAAQGHAEHAFDWGNYGLHLIFEGMATVGGFYARGFCEHTWHKVLVGIIWTMISTFLLVTLIG